MKLCIACGMPMKNKSDFAMEDTSKDYCKYCCREDGSMQSYEEKLNSLTNFIMNSQGLNSSSSKAAAIEMMSKLPAWK